MDFGKSLDEVEGGDFELMPIGDYLGYVEEATEEMSKNGNEMLHLQIRLAGNEKYNNRVMHHYLVMGNEYSLQNAKKLMIALGLDIKGMTGVKPATILNRPCKFRVKHETAQAGEKEGQLVEKIHYFSQIMGDEAAAVKNNIPNGGSPKSSVEEDFSF